MTSYNDELQQVRHILREATQTLHTYDHDEAQGRFLEIVERHYGVGTKQLEMAQHLTEAFEMQMAVRQRSPLLSFVIDKAHGVNHD